MKFSIKVFFSKCDQIRSFLWIFFTFTEKTLMENFIFCAVCSNSFNANFLFVVTDKKRSRRICVYLGYQERFVYYPFNKMTFPNNLRNCYSVFQSLSWLSDVYMFSRIHCSSVVNEWNTCTFTKKF